MVNERIFEVYRLPRPRLLGVGNDFHAAEANPCGGSSHRALENVFFTLSRRIAGLPAQVGYSLPDLVVESRWAIRQAGGCRDVTQFLSSGHRFSRIAIPNRSDATATRATANGRAGERVVVGAAILGTIRNVRKAEEHQRLDE
jgi:hypothetical protein